METSPILSSSCWPFLLCRSWHQVLKLAAFRSWQAPGYPATTRQTHYTLRRDSGLGLWSCDYSRHCRRQPSSSESTLGNISRYTRIFLCRKWNSLLLVHAGTPSNFLCWAPQNVRARMRAKVRILRCCDSHEARIPGFLQVDYGSEAVRRQWTLPPVFRSGPG